MTENLLLKKINIFPDLSRLKGRKVDYRLVALMIVTAVLIVQSFQLSVIKAELADGGRAAAFPKADSASYGSLPSMAGGC